MDPIPLNDLDQQGLRDIVRDRDILHRFEPEKLYLHWWPRCEVRVLLVTDGGLDFGSGDFGLRTFVTTLLHGTFPARFRVTLAHRSFRSGDAMMDGDPAIVARTTNFRFDDPGHFSVDAYDQVWMFGILSAPGIADTEVRAIAEFMEAGKGVFATGDHAALGQAMGNEVPRVRSMRLWDSTPGVDEVSMSGFRRNDTNRRGHDLASTFDDQSDDIPQVIIPRRYRTRIGIWEAIYPHPLLCGPHGAITVMPDHPHEGECVEPSDLSQTVTVAGASFVEYPNATDGGPRPQPEVISTSTVLTGTTSGGKAATQGHTFGGISAYDGHRAGIGRVVTDATWHHFININLVGAAGTAPPKDEGFLDTVVGQGHLAQIQTYYRNIATWISPEASIRCMNHRMLWDLVWHARVLEAVSTTATVSLDQVHPTLLWGIGKQARDVLGRRTSTCQTTRLVLEIVFKHFPRKFYEEIDPWRQERPRPRGPEPVPWFDPSPAFDIALGGAIVAIHEKYADTDRVNFDELDAILDDLVARGAEIGVKQARETAQAAVQELTLLLNG